MIYTVTLNPAIDYIVKVEKFKPGSLNRMMFEEKFPGGKGINVSRVLARLEVDNKALGFIGGFTGKFVDDILTAEGVVTDFVHVSGDTRINIVLKSESETEINGQGPALSSSDIDKLTKKLEQIQSGDTLVLAGNIPSTLPPNLYAVISSWAVEKEIRVVVDTSGKDFLKAVECKPFLVKPNHHELGYFFDTVITNQEEAIFYGKKLIELGAQNVIVSMADKGAILITPYEIYRATTPKGVVVNSVGAGDSLVAGFIGTYEKTNDYEKSLQVAVASGSATAFSIDICSREKIEELISKVEVTKI